MNKDVKYAHSIIIKRAGRGFESQMIVANSCHYAAINRVNFTSRVDRLTKEEEP